MDIMKSSQREWVSWIRDHRHISHEVSRAAGLSLHKDFLSIPVRDTEGNVLFRKYRRDPNSTVGPKYRYDRGATASLYGAETLCDLPPGDTVIVVESELDSLALRTLGYNAVSGTGGAGTWRDEWTELLAPFKVTFFYDADVAGIEGMVRASSKVPESRIALMPVQYGKDATEVIHNGNTHDLSEAIASASAWGFPHPDMESKEKMARYRDLGKRVSAMRADLLASDTGTPFHINIIGDWIDKEVAKLRAEVSSRDPVRKRDDLTSDIERARTFPIKRLIKVNREKKALCLAHQDSTPSMHVYDDHAYCFVCQTRFSPIDVYMTINKVDFKTAVAALQP